MIARPRLMENPSLPKPSPLNVTAVVPAPEIALPFRSGAARPCGPAVPSASFDVLPAAPGPVATPEPEVPSPDDPEARTPLWFDEPLDYDRPVPGLPSFVTPAWFRTHVRLTTTNLRRLRQGVDRRRKSDPGFLPWWPDGVQPTHDDLFWFVARAGLDKRESVSFSALLRKECRPTGDLRNASFFEPLIAAYSIDRKGKPVNAPRRYGSDMNFAAAYERGAEAAAKVLGTFMESDDPDVPADHAAMVEWYSERFPECFDDAERVAAARRAARIARLPPPTVEPEPPPEEVLPPVEDRLSAALSALAEAEAERAALSEDLDDLNSRHADLQREIASVRAGFDPRVVDPASESDELPETLETLVHWIETRLAPDVHVLPRAFRSLRKSPGFDVARIARGLRFLRDVYVPYRSDRGMPFSAYREALTEAGFLETPSFVSDSSIEAFPEYRAVWGGRTIELDRHLKRGVGTDARSMLRIYFHWDRATRTVVVGHMPGHLDNWKKN